MAAENCLQGGYPEGMDVITVCIPTYRRPELLKLAIESCYQQTYRPIEILIGDDSEVYTSHEQTTSLKLPEGISLRHVVHAERMGQSGNVNWLFNNAAGPNLILLHDDDLLAPHGLDMLVEASDRFPGLTCYYGKQYFISESGDLLQEETDATNARYDIGPNLVGIQASPVSAALLNQFPNNCFLLSTATARKIGYRTEADVGQQVDGDFAVRLALLKGCRWYYIDSYVSAYRLTRNSILRSRVNHGHHLYYMFILGLDLPQALQATQARTTGLERLSAEAVLDAALSGQRRLALNILTSKYYRLKFLSAHTAFRLLVILFPGLGNWLYDRLPTRRAH